jgi:DNA-binding transcriptional ArsR family regulator
VRLGPPGEVFAFMSFPIVRAQAHLGLDAVDVVVLLNMNMHWWHKGDFPFPRPTIIAKRMGVSKRTVERRIEKLVKAGLLERLPLTKEGNIRRYKLDGLVSRLKDAAAIGLLQREYHLLGKGDEDS